MEGPSKTTKKTAVPELFSGGAAPAHEAVPTQMVPVVSDTAPAAMTIYDKLGDPMVAVEKLGTWMAKSRMFGIESPEQGFLMAWTAISKKVNPLDLAREFHIIEGRLSKRADAAMAEFQSRKGSRRIKWLTNLVDLERAAYEITDQWGNTYLHEYTMNEAERAGYCFTYKDGKREYKKNWLQSRSDLLRARLIMKSIRMVEPDIIVGLYSPEEIQDFGDDSPTQQVGIVDIPVFGDSAAPADEPEASPAPVIGADAEPAPEPVKAPVTTDIPAIKVVRQTIEAAFLEDAALFDGFCEARGWAAAGEGYPGVSDSTAINVYKNLAATKKIFAAWKTKRLNDEKKAGK